jgi:tetratricopeptide (TPR) repeat protein
LTKDTSGDQVGAIADYDQAIALNPNFVWAYYNRGLARYKKGELEKAVGDYTQAIQMNPKFVASYYARAWSYLASGKGEPAYVDMLEYLRLAPKDDSAKTATVLVSYLGLRQAGRESQAKTFIDNRATEMNAERWPDGVVKYFHGELTADELIAMAAKLSKLTEAHTYLGIDDSLRKRREAALEHLRWVKEKGNNASFEYTLAVSELARLQASSSTPK